MPMRGKDNLRSAAEVLVDQLRPLVMFVGQVARDTREREASMYGTIRMHQEREYPGRISATELRNPDFPAYARAFGGFGISVERTEDFPAAFRQAQGFRQAGHHTPCHRFRSERRPWSTPAKAS
jgi:hypothetical protein